MVQNALPFHLGSGWRNAWMAAYGHGRPLAIEVGAARLHLLETQARLGPLRTTLLRSPTNLQTGHFGLDGDPPSANDLATLPRRLFQTSGASQVVLDYVGEDTPLHRAAMAWSIRHLTTVDAFARTSLVDCTGSWDAYLGAGGKSLRSYWKHCQREIFDNGTLALQRHRETPGLDAVLDEMFALEAAGWKGRAGSAILDDPAEELFYRQLARAAAERGALRILLLREGERLLAYDFALKTGETMMALKIAYDEAVGRLPLGHMLTLAHIHESFTAPEIARYDMLGNSLQVPEHKRRFATGHPLLYRVRLFARTPLGLALYAFYRARRQAKAMRDALRQRRRR